MNRIDGALHFINAPYKGDRTEIIQLLIEAGAKEN